MRRLTQAVLMFMGFQCAPLQAWDSNGHAIVAMLAEERLTPQTRAAVAALLEGHSMVEIASWPDQVRNKQTAPWHYVNIEIEESRYDPDRHCRARQCVIGQIERFRKTVTDTSINPKKRQKALKYLVHFVGDLHQPLHAGQNHDRGGNDVTVEFLGRTVNPFTKKPWNLHQVWDNGLLDQYASDAKQAVAQIDRYLKSLNEAELAKDSVIEWAIQSHDQARDHAYTFGADKRLDERYVKQALPAIEAQLARAGVRLAHLLNTALTNGSAGPLPEDHTTPVSP